MQAVGGVAVLRLELSPVRVFMLHASAAVFLSSSLSDRPVTPLPLSVYNLQRAAEADIEIDIETVEKLIGEIIVQPLR